MSGHGSTRGHWPAAALIIGVPAGLGGALIGGIWAVHQLFRLSDVFVFGDTPLVAWFPIAVSALVLACVLSAGAAHQLRLTLRHERSSDRIARRLRSLERERRLAGR